jgi:hypothetical protein
MSHSALASRLPRTPRLKLLVRARGAGSAAEVRACLDVAEALGYIEGVDEGMRDRLDRVVATLHQLSRR